MAERRTYQRQLLSPNYNPMTETTSMLQNQIQQGNQTINQMINQMTKFLSDKGMEYIEEEATVYGATNPVTMEDLEKIERGEDVLGKYGYGTRGKIARSVAFKSLASELEMAATKDMNNYMQEAFTQGYDNQTVADDLDAIALGYTSRLKDIDPTTAYNVRTRLSVISSGLYSDFIKDAIKVQQKEQHLSFLENKNNEIATLPQLIKTSMKQGGNPALLKTFVDGFREKLKGEMSATKMTTDKQFALLQEQNDAIDTGIIGLIIEEAQEENISLTSLAQDVRNGKPISDPEIEGYVMSLSEQAKADINKRLMDEINVLNEIEAITSSQTKANKDQLILDATQNLDKFIEQNSTNVQPIQLPPDVEQNINLLDKLGATESKFYKDRLKNMQLGHSITDDEIRKAELNRMIKDGVIEISDVVASKNKLTYDTFIDILDKTKNTQLTTDMKNWEIMAKKNKPIFMKQYDPQQFLVGKQAKEKELQRIILDNMNAIALQSNIKGQDFDPEKAYEIVIKDPSIKVLVDDIDRMTKSITNTLNQIHLETLKVYGINSVEDTVESLKMVQDVWRQNKSNIIEKKRVAGGKNGWQTIDNEISSRILFLENR